MSKRSGIGFVMRRWGIQRCGFFLGQMQLKRTCGSTLYNLDLVPPTIYIKRVLRPACFVALSLAAFSIAAGQPSVAPSTSPASKPPASKPAASQPPTSKSTPAPAPQTGTGKRTDRASADHDCSVDHHHNNDHNHCRRLAHASAS
jgi:hypothetical protein